MVAFSHLTLSISLAAAVLAHKDAQPLHQKRAVQVVTVTDVVWEYVTITRIGPKPTTFTILPSGFPIAAAPAVQAPAVAAPAAAAAPEAVAVPAPAANIAVSSDPLVEAAVNAPAVQAPVVQDAPAVVAASDAQVPPPAPVAAAPASAPAAVEASSSSSGSGSTFSGEATYYNLGLTACGQTFTDNDMVAAISFPLFNRDSPANPNLAPSCGKKIKVMRGGKSVVVQIRDKCEACKEYDVDLSPAAFNQLGVEQEGRFPITWQYL